MSNELIIVILLFIERVELSGIFSRYGKMNSKQSRYCSVPLSFSKTLKSPKNIQRKCKFMDDRNIFYTSLLCIFFRIKRIQHKSFYCCSSDCKLISLYQKANKVKMKGLTAYQNQNDASNPCSKHPKHSKYKNIIEVTISLCEYLCKTIQ